MSITVIVRSAAGADLRLTFDGTQRVVIGRGSGSDVRLPDASVSHRHASLEARGADFVLLDDGSTNGTFVGDVRIAPRTSRIVRSGDVVRVGRVRLGLQIDGSPVTRDLAAATREVALELVSRAMAALGADVTVKVHVVEGRDQGATLSLAEEGRAYVVGRAPHCDLPLADADVSREHVRIFRKGGAVFLRALGAKNGTLLGDGRAPEDREVTWRPAQMMKVGQTVLALQQPISDALADIETAADEVMGAGESALPAAPPSGAPAPSPPVSQLAAPAAPVARPQPARRPSRWSLADIVVMTAAVTILALSLAGLVWLLRG